MWKCNKYYAAFIMILFFQLAIIVYFGFQKENLHIDEYFSYYSTSDNDFYIGLKDGDWNKGSIMLDKCIVDEEHRFDYQNVYEMESKDVHPPLYYYFLHTICSVFHGNFTKWTGLGLNIFFFVISCFLLGKITWIVSRENLNLTVTVNAFYGLNPAVISGIMFIRMYMLLSVFILLFTYFHLRIVREQYRITGRDFVYITMTSLGGFLTHYYFIVYAAIFSLIFGLNIAFKRKKLKESAIILGAAVLGAGLAVWYYPACIEHIFFGYRGEGAKNAFFDMSNTMYRLRYVTHMMSKIAFNNKLKELFIVEIIGLAAAGVSFYKRKKEKPASCLLRNSEFITIIISTLGYCFVTSKTSLLNEDETIRYTLPVYGLLFLVLLYIAFAAIYYLAADGKARTICTTLLAAGFLILNICGLKGGKVLYLYQDAAERITVADAHSDAAAILIHGDGGWMWEIAGELEKYETFYSVYEQNIEVINDEKIQRADTLMVYVDYTNPDNIQQSIDMVLESNKKVKSYHKLFTTKFFEIYLFE